MKRIFFTAMLVSCLAAAAAPMTVFAQAVQDLGITRVTPDEIARVSGMTADYVRTPHGYFHASCVQRIDQSEELQADGSIRRADGKIRQVAACAYPHFLRSGVRVEATTKATHLPEVYNGYLQLVSTIIATGVNQLNATMTVPHDPASKSGQTLYFFPGLVDAVNEDTILQPVLGWDGYGVNNWTIASWNCCKSGTIYVGNKVVVKPLDRIYGTMVRTVAQSWTITATDETQTSLPSAVLNTSGFFQLFDWVIAGALETYGVSSCSQFPKTGPIEFTGIQAYVAGRSVGKPAWTIEPGTDPETACTGASIVNYGNVDISY
ncbi:MAG TPA: hypothetical protein VK753_05615 [Xanthomonadaceae bacterium]|jgi:hypothetical protein|nr:hypothetical protein [Xanthomonadaceae bacterium]